MKILGALSGGRVEDERIRTLADRANELTEEGYQKWYDNSPVLIPLMERILVLARETENWDIYFYDMARLFWLAKGTPKEQRTLAFRIAERFHRDYRMHLGEDVSRFGAEWRCSLAGTILEFYTNYPEIDDEKMDRMLEIYRDCAGRCETRWTCGTYGCMTDMARVNRDLRMAEEAMEKLKKTSFEQDCYICRYVKPMILCSLLKDDADSAGELVQRLAAREIPLKYQWCFTSCQSADEKSMVNYLLACCLWLLKPDFFARFFAQWRNCYSEPETGKLWTEEVLFHALAGDWTRQEERLELAQEDDQEMREQSDVPLNLMDWNLCWYCYFHLLHRHGVEQVEIAIGERGEKIEKREWRTLDVAAYFEKQADSIGERMDRARKRFDYAGLKGCYRACFLTPAEAVVEPANEKKEEGKTE